MSRLYPSGQAGPTVSAGATLPEGSRPLLVIGIVDVGLTSTPAGMANRLADVQAFSRTQASNSAAEETELLMHADDEHGVAYIVLSAAAGIAGRQGLLPEPLQSALGGWSWAVIVALLVAKTRLTGTERFVWFPFADPCSPNHTK